MIKKDHKLIVIKVHQEIQVILVVEVILLTIQVMRIPESNINVNHQKANH